MDTQLEIDTFTAERAWLTRLAYRMVHDRDVAEDVAQETLASAMRSPPPADRSARGWLARVATNVVRDRVRSESRRARREHAVAQSESVNAKNAFACVHQHEVAALLADAVNALDEPFRAAIRLRFFDELSIAEVAARQGVPVGTAGWRVHEGTKRLRAALDREAGGDARPWLMALVPVGPFVEPGAATGAAREKGSIGMTKWLVLGAAGVSVITATSVIAFTLKDSSEQSSVAPADLTSPTGTSTRGRTPSGMTPVLLGVPRSPTGTGANAAVPAASRQRGTFDTTWAIYEAPADSNWSPNDLVGGFNAYSMMMGDCIRAYNERSSGGAKITTAILRVRIEQDSQGPMVTDSDLVADQGVPGDAEFADCYSAVGYAFKFDEPIGAAGDRYMFELTHTSKDDGDTDATAACLQALLKRKPYLEAQMKNGGPGKVDDAEFRQCVELTVPGSIPQAVLNNLPPGATAEVVSDDGSVLTLVKPLP